MELDKGGRMQVAAWRLERALSRLEARLASRLSRFEADVAAAAERERLASELDACRSRARELESAGSAAASALGRAIAQIREVMAERAAEG